jgi:hypothetical protein
MPKIVGSLRSVFFMNNRYLQYNEKKLIVHRRVRSLRPLRAVGSRLYEPEAIGAKAYAPVGER